MELNKIAFISDGIQAKLDNMGRVTIPIDFRKSENILAGQMLECQFDGEAFYLFKPNSIQGERMKGIERKVDEMGRVKLTQEWIDKLGWKKSKTKVKIFCTFGVLKIVRDGE